MAEQQGEHRRLMESKALDADVEAMKRGFWEARIGQFCAWSISITFIIAGSYIAIKGQPIPGTILGGIGLSSIVASFLSQRQKQPEKQLPPQSRKKR